MKRLGRVLPVLFAMSSFGCVQPHSPQTTYDYDLCDRVQSHPTDDNINERVRCAKSEERMLATSDR